MRDAGGVTDAPEADHDASEVPPPGPTRSGPAFGLGAFAALLGVFVVLLGIGLGLRALQDGRPGGDDGFHGAVFDPPRPRYDFQLTTTDGEPFDFAAETQGQLTLLFFGYTHCPDVCPITLTTLDGALGELDGVAARVVFVTVDPERDTDEALAEWLGRFDVPSVGLRGTPEEIDAALAAADLPPPTFSERDEDGSYTVGHSSRVFLIGADDQVRIVYPFGIRQGEWVEDLSRARDEGWASPTDVTAVAAGQAG